MTEKTKNKDTFFRITGISGLIILILIFSLIPKPNGKTPADKPVTPSNKSHDHSDPEQHGDISAKPLNNSDKQLLAPSGTKINGKRVVTMEAFQYGFSPDPLVVLPGENVLLRLKSKDVNHGITIPEINFTSDIPAKGIKEAEFKSPEKPGKYPIFCSTYCGSGHGNMTATMIVIPKQNEPGKTEKEHKNGH